MPIVLKSWSLILLEPSGPVQACNGIALFFFFTVPFTGIYIVLKCTGGNKEIISAFVLCCGIARTEVIGQGAVLVVSGFIHSLGKMEWTYWIMFSLIIEVLLHNSSYMNDHRVMFFFMNCPFSLQKFGYIALCHDDTGMTTFLQAVSQQEYMSEYYNKINFITGT